MMGPMHDIAWASGLFEGEGSFLGGAYPRMQFKMVDEDVVRRFHAVVGVGRVNGPYQGSGNRQPYWEWRCGGDEAKALAEVMVPYLGTRRSQQARPVLDWQRKVARVAVCGTHSGCNAHYRRGEQPCEPCVMAHREHERARYHAARQA